MLLESVPRPAAPADHATKPPPARSIRF